MTHEGGSTMTTTEDVKRAAGRVFAAGDGREIRLAMQDLFVGGRVTPAGARLAVRHVFASAMDRPLEVIYAFMLPRDAALRKFEVVGKDFRVTSDLKPTADAEKEYEDAMEHGRLAVLAREHEDGLVNLAVGNLRPGEMVAVHLEILAGVEARDGGFRFRFPFTVSPVYQHGARYGINERGEAEMDLPSSFGGALMPVWRPDAEHLHRVSFDLEVDAGATITRVQSPSHPLQVDLPAGGPAHAKLAVQGDVPDRDLVLDVEYAAGEAALLGARGEFVAVIPSTVFGDRSEDTARRVVFVLDRSGSMEGGPLDQAKRALRACLAALSPDDRFSLVAFDDQVEVPDRGLLAGDRDGRAKAEAFLDQIGARGGTELATAVKAAAKLGGRQADLFILTDGQVGGTDEILASVRKAGCRLHTLGIGSASQDRFLARLARDTGGVGRFVTPRERVDEAALDLFAAVGRPVAEGVKVRVEGDDEARIEPAPAEAVFAGTPLLVYGHIAPGVRKLLVEWAGKRARREIAIPERDGEAEAETARLLRGARMIADYSPAEAEGDGPVARRGRKRAEGWLAALSAEYGLASRAMSLVAVVKRKGDRPGELPETKVVPVMLPQDLARRAYFHASPMFANNCMAASAVRGGARGIGRGVKLPTQMLSESESGYSVDQMAAETLRPAPGEMDHATSGLEMAGLAAPTGGDLAMELAWRIEPDGGMPGASADERVAASLVLIGLLVTLDKGRRFRPHLKRLRKYLAETGIPSLPEAARSRAEDILHAIDAGPADSAVWSRLASRLLDAESLRVAELP
jgi:Ca-activated chloride channel homolog